MEYNLLIINNLPLPALCPLLPATFLMCCKPVFCKMPFCPLLPAEECKAPGLEQLSGQSGQRLPGERAKVNHCKCVDYIHFARFARFARCFYRKKIPAHLLGDQQAGYHRRPGATRWSCASARAARCNQVELRIDQGGQVQPGGAPHRSWQPGATKAPSAYFLTSGSINCQSRQAQAGSTSRRKILERQKASKTIENIGFLNLISDADFFKIRLFDILNFNKL